MSTVPVDRHLRHFIEAGWPVRRLAQFARVPERTMRYWVNEAGEMPAEAAQRLCARLEKEAATIREMIRQLNKHLS